jgi:hypothetical protein
MDADLALPLRGKAAGVGALVSIAQAGHLQGQPTRWCSPLNPDHAVLMYN